MSENRKYPRYKVSKFSKLSGRIGKIKDDKFLVTFGAGGCGFYAAKMDDVLTPITRVSCNFYLESAEEKKTFEVQGNVMYVKTIPLGEKEVFFYGIEFLEVHRHHIAPILEELEKAMGLGDSVEYA